MVKVTIVLLMLSSVCLWSTDTEAALEPALGSLPRKLGGWRPLSHEEMRQPMYQNALQQVVKKYNMASNNAFHYVLYNVENATVKVVSGLLMKFVVTLVPSKCFKSNPSFYKTLNGCGIGDGHAHQCSATVYHQPWRRDNSMGKAYRVKMQSCAYPKDLHLHENVYHTGANDEEIGSVEQFEVWKSRFNRVYFSDEEEEMRYQNFRANMRKASLLQLLELGSGEYGMTPFSDLSHEEFRKEKLTPKWDLDVQPLRRAPEMDVENVDSSFDWRDHGAVTPIKNQGSCGSCWAFSVTGNVEGQWFVKKQKLISLSEQELVDCDKVDHGCNGGLPTTAYKEIERIGGLESEEDYPYKGHGEKCSFKPSLAKIYINDSVLISKDEDQMAAWLVKNGPISIGINANLMQFYRGGVSHPWSFLCSKTALNHGVLIVGYGVAEKKNEPYWIVKNSWGTGWGEKGYYLVHRGDGTCGLNQMCTSAVVY